MVPHSINLRQVHQLSLETEVEQMINDMMKKEGSTRSYTLSVLRSKFESEERYQEVAYVNNLIKEEDNKNSDNTSQFQKDY
ncbi:MAG TPA: hypothetical protein VE076_01335 [Nitrososphaeraceae archaeon]|jgi:hypothetical protein|nr:hypothetical protein [Nitrososphaeraceae archaeon]